MGTRPGLEVLLEEKLDLVLGRRVGLIVHPASIDSRLRSTLDLFHRHPEIRLIRVMGPQHGVRGETQDNMIEWEGYTDPLTGLPVHSLYGRSRSPGRELLKGLDVLVFDLQDVGARYYTFIWTMALAMKACAAQDVTFLVLDRPNPIGGLEVEGPVLEEKLSSFVGLYPLPVRHGMTVGEVARYLNQEFSLGCQLEIVAMTGWERQMFFEETGLPWVVPSPNLPTVESALVYPGLCLLEGTNVSEGRGTTRPFEMSGAPWINPFELADALSAMSLPGVVFRPIHFTPTFHKWKDQTIGGVQVHVTGRGAFRPFLTGLAMLRLYREMGGPRFVWKQPPYEYEYEKLPIDILCGTRDIREGLERGDSLGQIEGAWQDTLRRFAKVRQRHLLY